MLRSALLCVEGNRFFGVVLKKGKLELFTIKLFALLIACKNPELPGSCVAVVAEIDELEFYRFFIELPCCFNVVTLSRLFLLCMLLLLCTRRRSSTSSPIVSAFTPAYF